MDKKLGELNGVWSLLLKVFLVAVLPWGIWVTNNQYKMAAFMEKGDRWTEKQALGQELRIYDRLDAKMGLIQAQIDRITESVHAMEILQATQHGPQPH